ncbi:M50 family metallopeptidase [Aquibacillus sp. 3ASR75-11]|uniref:M50 family metallopeptidase n=1 Tax=Terrihalobacillus insolitus TaxID=2950438 RepID=A0A9X3WNA7_9BACI|nr:M50 family metallopeptidase [Terrihalobacillus insolitus]MDC3412130.1 M50 family metallopeptidase [Terrihalobacillus insolitus]MDC3423177.1 M50 family metallopeptidase [Terrihalobacillus insolitus]
MSPVYYIILAFLLTKLPIVGTYFRLVNTIIHEVFHVFVSKITGGKAHNIALNTDTSGHAVTSTTSWLSRVLTAYAGYTGSSLTAFGFYYLLYNEKETTVAILILAVTVLATILWVRNLFGIIWSISFTTSLGYLVYKQMDVILVNISFFLSAVLLVESIRSAIHIMVISIKRPNEAGDAKLLQRCTLIPAVVWGVVFFVQSIYVGYKIAITFLI